MSATFMDANEPLIKHVFGDITQDHPWTFAIALFLMGALTFSQAATTRTMMPMGVALGISILTCWPCSPQSMETSYCPVILPW